MLTQLAHNSNASVKAAGPRGARRVGQQVHIALPS